MALQSLPKDTILYLLEFTVDKLLSISKCPDDEVLYEWCKELVAERDALRQQLTDALANAETDRLVSQRDHELFDAKFLAVTEALLPGEDGPCDLVETAKSIKK